MFLSETKSDPVSETLRSLRNTRRSTEARNLVRACEDAGMATLPTDAPKLCTTSTSSGVVMLMNPELEVVWKGKGRVLAE
jgi:hypothetical protein